MLRFTTNRLHQQLSEKRLTCAASRLGKLPPEVVLRKLKLLLMRRDQKIGIIAQAHAEVCFQPMSR